MSEGYKPSYLHIDSPAGSRKRPRVHPFKSKFSEIAVQKDRRNVYLRIKPNTGECNTFVVHDEHTVVPIPNETLKARKGIFQQYKFTKVFRPTSQQDEVFKETCISPLNNFLNGGNCLVFAYGATNAGKTYTMQGSPEDPGIIPRALNLVFNSINDRVSKEVKLKPDKTNNVLWLTPEDIEKELEIKQFILNFNVDKNKVFRSASALSVNSEVSQCGISYTADSSVICPYFNAMKRNFDHETIELDENGSDVFSVWVSYAEIYNENIYDLLQTSKHQKPLIMGENNIKDVFIKGLTEVCVFSAEEAFKIFMYGRHNLHQASTSINHVSSRSHSIFAIKLVKHMKTDCPTFARLSMCTFVDLAGAERAKKTLNAGERMKESQSINTSLHVLGKCFDVLRHNQKGSVSRMLPCRESKLTRLFQRALEGKEVLTMIVNINQDKKLFDETLNVLKFSAIAMELQFEKPQDSTFCSLRKSSFSMYLEKFSSTFQSSMDDIEEAPEDARYMKLLAYIEELKKNLEEEKKKNLTIEVQVRKESYMLYCKMIKEMEEMYKKRLEDEREAHVEYEVQASEMFKQYLKKNNYKLSRESISEGEDEEEEDDDDSDDEDSEEKIKFLENKVEALTGLVEAGEQMKQAHHSLQAKYSKLQCEMAIVKQELESALKVSEAIGKGDDTNDTVVKEINEQLAKQKSLCKEKNSEIEVLKKLVEDAKTEYDEHFHEHEDFAARNSELEKMLADRDMKIDDLQVQLDICNKKLTQQQQRMADKEFEESECVNKLQQACESRDELKFKVLQLECDIKKLEKENNELKDQTKSPKNDKVKSLEVLLASHEDQLKMYEEKLKNEKKENEELRLEISVLKSQSICSNSDSYEKEISILQIEIKESVKNKKELMDKIEQLDRKLQDVTEALKLSEAALTEEQNNTKAMRRICESEKNELLQELQQEQDSLKKLEEEFRKLSTENNNLRLQNMELEESLKVKEDQMEAFKNRRDAQFETYENLLKHERELREREQREVHQMHNVMMAHTPKKSEYLAQISNLKEQLKEALMKISTLEKENQLNFMDDISNRKDLPESSYKPRSRTRKPKELKENVDDGEDDIVPLFSPQIPIKPDPDSRRELRPRRKKALYTGDERKDDIGILQSKGTRRRNN